MIPCPFAVETSGVMEQSSRKYPGRLSNPKPMKNVNLTKSKASLNPSISALPLCVKLLSTVAKFWNFLAYQIMNYYVYKNENLHLCFSVRCKYASGSDFIVSSF